MQKESRNADRLRVLKNLPGELKRPSATQCEEQTHGTKTDEGRTEKSRNTPEIDSISKSANHAKTHFVWTGAFFSKLLLMVVIT